MKHYRHPGEKEDPRPIRPWNIYAVQSITNPKNGSHRTNEKQKGFQEVYWIDFFATVQQVHDAVKRKGPQYGKSDWVQTEDRHLVAVSRGEGKHHEYTKRCRRNGEYWPKWQQTNKQVCKYTTE